MRALAILCLLLLLSAPARAEPMIWPDWLDARVCPAGPDTSIPPDFDAPGCGSLAVHEIDPQGRLVWARFHLELTREQIEALEPAGLYISAKASSTLWLNGRLTGENGVPGLTRAHEVPGRMDAVFYLPAGRLNAGENTLLVLMSSHHGLIRLGNPVHFVALAPYRDPSGLRLAAYAPALMTFGALLIGAVYFAATGLQGPTPAGSAALAAAAAAASGQLVTEAWRGLFAYAYPVHDLRLILIVLFAGVAGTALAMFAWSRVHARGHGVFLACALALAAGAGLVSPGFDLKAILALTFPVVFAAGALLVQVRASGWRAGAPLLILLAFIAAIGLSPEQFLDRYFYLLMAGLLFALFFQQASHLARERRLRQEEEGRAQRLQAALARAREREMPTRLSVVSAGRVDLIEAETILRCQGAGDYVELHLTGGACLLHDGTLNALEEQLPATFLRVHRSHIVNTSCIAALDRDVSGVGALTLSNGDRVPVSRRIMPRVRSALRGAPLASGA